MKREPSVFVLRPQESAARSADDWCRLIVPPVMDADERRFLRHVYAAYGESTAEPSDCGPQDSVTRGPHTPKQTNATPCAVGTLDGETSGAENSPSEVAPECPIEQRKRLALLVGGNPYGGWDTVEVSCWVKWDGFHSTRHFERLAQAAAACRLGGGAKQFVELAGHECEVSGGRRFGGVWTNYTVRVEGITFCVAERAADSTIPNVFVRVGALPLLASSLRECWDTAVNFIESLGGEIDRHSVSRGDFCADMPNVGGRALFNAVMGRRYVSEARKATMWRDGTELTGIRVGSEGADCMVRAYDKVAELKQRGDDVKWQAMVAHRWGCEPEQATRCEYQMRGKFLRSISLPGCEDGVRTVDQLIACEAALMAYLTEEWFRLISGQGGAAAETKHRQKTSRHWKQWQQWFYLAADCKSVVGVKRIERKSCNADRVRRQGMGCLLKAVALTEEEQPRTKEDWAACVARQTYQWLEDVGGDEQASARTVDKFREVDAMGPFAKQPLGGDGAALPCPGEAELPREWAAWFQELERQRGAIPF